MSLPGEATLRAGRAARRTLPAAVGAAVGSAFLLVLGFSFEAAFAAWWAGTGMFGVGFYCGEVETVERIRSYLHREER